MTFYYKHKKEDGEFVLPMDIINKFSAQQIIDVDINDLKFMMGVKDE